MSHEPALPAWNRWLESGDRNCFDDACLRLRPRLLSWCRLRLGDDDLAEDAAQAVLLVAFQRRPRWRHEGAMTAWLWKTAEFVCRKAARLRRRQKTEPLVDEPAVEVAEGSGSDLMSALDRLRPAEREALLLRHQEGLTVGQIAERLGIGESAAQMRLSRATDRLRCKLKAAPALLVQLRIRPEDISPSGPAGPQAAVLASEAIRGLSILAAGKAAAGVAAAAAIGSATWLGVHGGLLPPRPPSVAEQDPGRAARMLDRIAGTYAGRVEWRDSLGAPGSIAVQARIGATSDSLGVRMVFIYSGGDADETVVRFGRRPGQVWINNHPARLVESENRWTLSGQLPSPDGPGRTFRRSTLTLGSDGGLELVNERGDPLRRENRYLFTPRPGP
ncbi:MAG: RNA polymerase sigma factor [Fimbriimonadaceae bacterium]|nr:RNA polymerase sigma factor [Fimbriimonadaceae bacterium]